MKSKNNIFLMSESQQEVADFGSSNRLLNMREWKVSDRFRGSLWPVVLPICTAILLFLILRNYYSLIKLLPNLFAFICLTFNQFFQLYVCRPLYYLNRRFAKNPVLTYLTIFLVALLFSCVLGQAVYYRTPNRVTKPVRSPFPNLLVPCRQLRKKAM